MATHTADLVLKDLVVEPGLELALPGGGGGDVHGGLAAAEYDKVLLGRDAGAVERRICRVRLEDVEIACRDELGRLILGRRDEVGPVGRPLQVRHGTVKLVDGHVVDEITVL